MDTLFHSYMHFTAIDCFVLFKLQIKGIKKDFLELREELIVPVSSSRTYNFCVLSCMVACMFVYTGFIGRPNFRIHNA